MGGRVEADKGGAIRTFVVVSTINLNHSFSENKTKQAFLNLEAHFGLSH